MRHLIAANVTLIHAVYLLSVEWLRLHNPRNVLLAAIRWPRGGAGREILGRPSMASTNLLEAGKMDEGEEEDGVSRNQALRTLFPLLHPFKSQTRCPGLPR